MNVKDLQAELIKFLESLPADLTIAQLIALIKKLGADK